MRNKKKLERVIALALMCGSCAVNVTEASGAYVYGNSPNRPSDYITSPSAGDNASEFVFDFDSSIHAGTVWTVYGGYAINVDALSNTLNLNSGTAGGAYAGYVSGNGNADGNVVNFFNGTVDSVFGGYVSGHGNANANKLTVTDGSIEYGIFGGYSDNGASNNNKVTVNGGRFPSRSSGYVGGIISGGQSRNENANNNTVTIKADINGYEVRGGEAYYGNSDNNTINIMSGADHIGDIKAGHVYVPYTLVGADTNREYTSNSNKVVVDTNGNIGVVNCGYVHNTATAYKVSSNDNKIIVDNGNIGDNNSSMFAGDIEIDSSKADDTSYIQALNNTVTLNNGKAQGSVFAVYIGDANSIGTSYVNNKTPITISGNNITINGGEIGEVYGICDANVVASTLEVKDNSVDIRGGVVQNDVYGGGFGLDNLSTIESANNTVNWYGGNVNGSIYGYMYSNASNYNSHYISLRDSTFNFFASSNHSNKTIANLSGFENYHFYLDDTVPANAILINLTGYADLDSSNVGVAVMGSSPLQKGESVVLLDATHGEGISTASTNVTNNTSRMTAQNIYNVYDFTLRNEGGRRLVATLGNTTRNPKAENLMGIRSAEAFMTYDKVDVVDKAYQASKHTSEPSAFIEYGYSDITTKDDTKLRGSNVLWGIASTIGGEKDQANTLTRGIFFEYGDGTFSSIGHYPTGSIYGYGKSKKFGMGVLARKVMFDRHYYDAYLRAGTIKTDYDAFAEGVGNIKYDNRDMYFSGNLGYGQFIQLTPNLQMDAYIKYFYNRIPGHSTTAYTNGVDAMPISFDVFENHRFRLGSKFTWDYMDSNNYKWYADVALEQEFAKDQSGSINSHRISKSNGSSTTGVIELCYENKFGLNNAFMFTAKAQGYVGDRRGLGASANLSFSF